MLRRASSRGTEVHRSRRRRAGEGAECRGRAVPARALAQRPRLGRVTIETTRPMYPRDRRKWPLRSRHGPQRPITYAIYTRLLDPDVRAHPRMEAALHASDAVGIGDRS